MNLNKQNLINKIIFKSKYRGTKEMDIFVTSFTKSIINELNINELNDLVEIIDLDDQQILKICKDQIKNNNYNEKIVSRLIKFKDKY